MTSVKEDCANVSLDSFKVLNLLGSGGFSNVFKVRKLNGKDKNKLYAMKVLRSKGHKRDGKYVNNAQTEKDILEQLNHPFLINMEYALQNEGNLCMILEYASEGDLGAYLDRVKRLSHSSAAFYMSQMVLAVKYLHAKGIVHRDIKLTNILLASNGYVKLSDFGLSGYEGSGTNAMVGTLNYMAPEILKGDTHGKEVDWWAIGIILHMLITGRHPYSNENDAELVKTDPQSYLTMSSRNLIYGLLQTDPKQRLGAEGAAQIMKQDFFMATCWKSIMAQTQKPPFIPKKKSKIIELWDRLLEVENIEIFESLNVRTGETVKKYDNLFKSFGVIG